MVKNKWKNKVKIEKIEQRNWTLKNRTENYNRNLKFVLWKYKNMSRIRKFFRKLKNARKKIEFVSKNKNRKLRTVKIETFMNNEKLD